MPSINNPATATVKVISADKGIKFYNSQTRQIEEVVTGQEIPANAVLEFSQQAELELSLDGQTVIIQGSSGTEQSIAKSFGLGTPETTTDAADSTGTQYQSLPSLQKISEMSGADFKPARTAGGFSQPVIERTGTEQPDTAYDLVVDDIRHTETRDGIISAYAEPEEEADTAKELAVSGDARFESPALPPVSPTPQQPEAPVITGINPDSGASDKDLITNSTEFDILGTSASGFPVDLLCEGQVIQTGISVNSSGEWSHHWKAPSGTEDKSFNFTARAVNNGVASESSDPALVMVKTSKPELNLDNEQETILKSPVIEVSGKTRGFNKTTIKFKELEETLEADSKGLFKFELDPAKNEALSKQFQLNEEAKTATAEYQIVVEDAAGNITSSGAMTLVVPKNPTNIKIDPDTGYISDDLQTNSHKVAITGNCLIDSGQPISVQINDMTPVAATVDDTTGQWHTEVFDLEVDGVYTVKAWYGASDSSPEELRTAETSFTINSTKPTFDDDSFLQEPIHSNAVIPTLDVTTKAGNQVTAVLLDSDKNVVSKAFDQAASVAHLKFDAKVPEGKHTLKVVLTDPLGNEAEREQDWYADFTKPDAPVLELLVDEDAVVDGESYVQSQVSVLATSETDAKIRFVDAHGNALTPAGAPVPDGTKTLYRLDFSKSGPHEILAQCTDLAGNESSLSEPVAFEVLTAAPTVDQIDVPEETVHVKAGDVAQVQVDFDQRVKLTNPGQLKLILQLDEGKTVEASFIQQSENGKSLTFNYKAEPGDNATKGVVVPAEALVDPASIKGLSGVALEPFVVETTIPTLVIDTIAPDAPEITHLSVNSVDNPSFSTNASEFDVMGRAESSSIIQLYDADSDEKIGISTHILGNTDWWIPVTTSTDEVTEVRVYAIATDAAGNTSPKSATVTIVSDPVRPEIESISGAESAREYLIGDDVEVTVKFSKPVEVSGSPGLNLLVGDTGIVATLDKDNTGPDRLTFKYPVTVDSPASGQISVALDALRLGDGDSIQDTVKNPANPKLEQPHALDDSIKTAPDVTGIDIEEQAGAYTTGQTLSFKVQFNKPVSLSSKDIKLVIQLDGEQVSLPLSEDAGLENTSSVVFKYTIEGDQSAANGITVVEFEPNGTTITDSAEQSYSGTAFNEEFSSHRVDTSTPDLLNIDLSGADPHLYALGKTINVELTFSEPVKVSKVDGKLPQLVLTIGDKAHTLTLPASADLQKVHTLRYTVVDGDNGALTLAPPDLNGASITDEAGLPANITCQVADVSAYVVDTTAPAIQDVTLAEGLYKTGDVLEPKVTFNKAMTLNTDGGKPSLVLVIGGDEVSVPLADGAVLVDSKQLTFRHELVGGQNGTVSVKAFKLNGATLTDSTSPQVFDEAGYNGTALENVQVDTKAPVLETIDLADTDQSLVLGKVIKVALTFDEPVKVAEAEGKLPQLVLTIGDKAHTLTLPASADLQKVHTLRYTVVDGDNGTLTLGPLDLNGASITDEAGLPANITCQVADVSAYVVDTTAPAIQDVTLAEGLYKTGDVLEPKVTFNKAMTLNTDGGKPSLVLVIGGDEVVVPLADGAVLVDSKQLTFRHELVEGQNGTVSVKAFKLNGATLTDSTSPQVFDEASYNGTALENVQVDTKGSVLETIDLADTDQSLVLGKVIKLPWPLMNPSKSQKRKANCHSWC